MNDTQYLALTDELRGVFREIFKEIWPRYIENALYIDIPHPPTGFLNSILVIATRLWTGLRTII